VARRAASATEQTASLDPKSAGDLMTRYLGRSPSVTV
jgi:hypothetical protein